MSGTMLGTEYTVMIKTNGPSLHAACSPVAEMHYKQGTISLYTKDVFVITVMSA